jgi:transposase
MSAYSQDLRQRIVDAALAGEGSVRELADRFRVSPNTVQNYITLWRETGNVAPRPRRNGPVPRIPDEQLERVRSLISRQNDRTLAEYTELWTKRYRVAVSKSAFARALQRARVTRKKKTLSATEQDSDENRLARWWFVHRAHALRSHHFIFLDEFGFSRATGRRYGRADSSARARGKEPANADPNLTLIVGLDRNGPIAPLMFPGAMDGLTFTQYVDTALGPWLKRRDVVVWDGLGAHRAVAARKAIERRGARVLALPGYSPDLNPDEELGSKLKTLARGRPHGTAEALTAAVGWAYGHVTAAEARGWFSHRAWYLSNRTKWTRELL